MPAVVLATPPDAPADDLRAAVAAAGFAVAEVPFDSVELPDCVAAIASAGEPIGPAVAFVRRVRQTGGVPILWVSPPEHAVAGLNAGAVAVHTLPLNPELFAVQVRSLARFGERFAELAARAAEARQRNAELQAAYEDIDRGMELARRVHRLLLPARLPEVGPVRLAVHHRPRSRTGGGLYGAARLSEHHVGFWVAVPGGSAATGGLLGVVIKHAVSEVELREAGTRPASPAEVLGRVNRAFLELGVDPPPLAGMAYGLIDACTGVVALSRGGVPSPVRVPADGPAELWAWPGPFLGAFDADFPVQTLTLRPGERLILRTGTPNVEADPFLPAAVRHRPLTGPAYADAVARDVSLLAADEDELTVLVAEMAASGTVQGQ